MKYLAVLGREPKISLAELEALFSDVQQISNNLATFEVPENAHSRGSGAWQGVRPLGRVSKARDERRSPMAMGRPDAPREGAFLARLGGCLKLAIPLNSKPLEYLSTLPDGKLTIGVSDYSKKATKKSAISEALKLKQILARHKRSVRVVPGDGATLSTATSLHNGLSGKNERKVELIKFNNDWYKVVGVQNIDAYRRRDQERPARDAKVGMLPPKLAQILINLCGPLPENARILDPFCGTGVVLQEALLMNYSAYGTDLNPRMIEYSKKNLNWLLSSKNISSRGSGAWQGEDERRSPMAMGRPDASQEGMFLTNLPFECSVGDATNFTWQNPIDAVACEGYLGQPMSTPPVDIKLKTEKQTCKDIVIGFLKNLGSQITSGTPVVIAVPAWLRNDGSYSRLEILDLLPDMGYNVNNKSREGLLYYREGQIVARDIIILRKT